MRFRRLAEILNLVTALAFIGSPGCATHSPVQVETQFLNFENLSPDAVRVFLDFGHRQVRLGTVESVGRHRLRIPRGSFSRIHSDVRIVVTPVGAPGVFISAVQFGSLRYASEWYPPDDLLRGLWRYTGRQVLMVGTEPCCGRQLNDADPGPINNAQISSYNTANRVAEQLTRF